MFDMTIYEIELLFHFHTSPEPPQEAPILRETIDRLVDLELLKYTRYPRGDPYSTAPDSHRVVLATRGALLINKILNTDLPTYPEEEE
jgi:hypothetical protein